MAIKGLKKDAVVSVFNPTLKAYHEVPVEDLVKQLQGLGFTDEAISERVEALKKAQGGEEV